MTTLQRLEQCQQNGLLEWKGCYRASSAVIIWLLNINVRVLCLENLFDEDMRCASYYGNHFHAGYRRKCILRVRLVDKVENSLSRDLALNAKTANVYGISNL
jgi:hypothetical protein